MFGVGKLMGVNAKMELGGAPEDMVLGLWAPWLVGHPWLALMHTHCGVLSSTTSSSLPCQGSPLKGASLLLQKVN